MGALEDLAKLQGEKNAFNKYDRKHTRRKVWTIVIIVTILVVAMWLYAKTLLTYTLSFDAMGGTAVPSAELGFMDPMVRPKADPKKPGYYLAGWTKDKDGKKPFVFGSGIWWDTTAYAKWEEGVALKLYFAVGEENDDLSQEELTAKEEWYKPGTSTGLPMITNTNPDSPHYGERLLWFEDENCTGDPIFDKTYTLNDIKVVYGKWFDIDESKFTIGADGTLKKYIGYCHNIILPAKVKYIKDISRNDFNTGFSDQLHDADDPNFSVFESVISSLKSVYLNDGILRIGNCAFKDCGELKTIKSLGNTLMSIGEYAFENTKIETFELSSVMETIGANAFNGASNLKTMTIEPNIVEIQEGAFANTGLRTIILPNVANIGKKAFMGCNNLKKVYFLNPTMVNANTVTIPEMTNPDSDNVFKGTASVNAIINELYIYVPANLVDDYQNSHPWSVYAAYFRMDDGAR